MNNENGDWIGWGPNDQGEHVKVIEHRLLKAFPRSTQSVKLGVVEDEFYTEETRKAVQNFQIYINATEKLGLREDGICDAKTQYRLGSAVKPAYRPRYPIQGVFHNTNAFLNPDPYHNFIQATDEGANEGFRLYSGMVGTPIIPIGYSMGGVTVKKFLDRLPPEWHKYVKMVVTFGDPATPITGSLLGNTDGEGISKTPQPEWVRDRYYSFAIDGDWYPQARGLLFLMYEILTRAALTMDFAMYLFTVFPMKAFQQLIGKEESTDPLSGALASLGGLMTVGPTAIIGNILPMAQIFQLLPDLIRLLFDAVRFIATNAHGKYGDPAYALWNGQTGVDHAVSLIREHVPDGATLFLFPGTWSMWNFGFQMDVAARLQ